jgi:spore germination protein GerM
MLKRFNFGKTVCLIITICLISSLFAGCTIKDSNPSKGTSSVSSSTDTVVPDSQNDKNTDETPDNTTIPNNKKVTMVLYFPGNDGVTVLKEKREVEVIDGAIIRAAVNALIEGPKDKRMRNGIPNDTKLLGAKVINKIATLSFSKEFTKPNDVAEIMEKVSLVNTITELAGIEKVHVLIEGNEWIAPSGYPYGDMTYTKLNEKGGPLNYESKTITLYFGNSNADAIVAEKRNVSYEKGKKIEAVIFEELSKGPTTKGLGSVIPKGTKVISAETKSGICYLNLSSEFIDNCHTGSAGEAMIVNSIVNSITELSGLKSVQFLIEGQKRKTFVHMVFDKPISRNTAIIKK